MSNQLSLFDVNLKYWENKKIKYTCSINKEVLSADTPPDFEFEYVDIGGVEYGKGIIEKATMYFEDSPSRARRKVESGDVIISTVRTYLKAITAISDIDKDVIVSTGFAVIHPEKINNRYVAYLLTSKPFVETVVSESVGVSYPAINPTKLAVIKIPFPQREAEQIAIANFLDKETSKIRTKIEKIKKMIELLKEKKEVLIINAVTKGLDPTVPMKDSNVNWIGKIPAHWEVKKIKRLSNVRRGASPRPIDDDKYYDENGLYSWVRIGDVTSANMYLNTAGDKLSLLGEQCSVKIEPDELFVSICASVGKPCISKIMCCIHDGFVYFPQLDKRYTKLLYYIFLLGKCYGGLGKLGTQLNLNTETIGSIIIPIPHQEELDSIINYLGNTSTFYDKLISKNEELIKKLTEYQEALITAAVTGKIDVRGE